MFSVGDHIIYGIEGVCRVEAIGRMNVDGLDKNREYYRLRPVYSGGTIYTPVDGRTVMRPVISRQELETLLPEARQMEPLTDVPSDFRAAGEYYRSILAQHDCRMLLRLCKTLYQRQAALSGTRRSISSTELRSWRMAEQMLYGEFGFVLGMPPAEVKPYLQKQFAGE